MDEINRQIRILILFLILVFILILLYKADFFWNFAKGFPLHTNSGRCNTIINNLCLAEDSGLKVDYYTASSLCSKRGMYLPTLEDAWLIWTSSENCKRAFASNEMVVVNKEAFINNCSDYGSCIKPASQINNYCTKNSVIKFSKGSQYKYGNFWLKDGNDKQYHYAINYSTGKVGLFSDKENSFGVRCVKY